MVWGGHSCPPLFVFHFSRSNFPAAITRSAPPTSVSAAHKGFLLVYVNDSDILRMLLTTAICLVEASDEK